jgi:hypothetical protein
VRHSMPARRAHDAFQHGGETAQAPDQGFVRFDLHSGSRYISSGWAEMSRKAPVILHGIAMPHIEQLQ